MRYCTICGQEHNSSACPPKQTYYSEQSPLVKTGWACPVCGCGNAPAALKCGHCKPPKVIMCSNEPDFSVIPPEPEIVNNG